MARNLRDRHVNQDPEGIEDNNGIIHTTSRSLRKINYAEIESGFDYLENEDEEQLNENNKEANNDAIGNGNDKLEEHGDDDDEDEDEVMVHRNHRGPVNGVSEDVNWSGERRGRRTRIADANADDDESFHEDEEAEADIDEDDLDVDNEDDDYGYYVRNARKRRRNLEDKSFVVPDPENEEEEDEEEDEGGGYSMYNRRRKQRNEEDGYQTTRRLRRRQSTPPPPRNLRRRTRSSHADDESEGGEHKSDEALTLEDEIRELQDDSPIHEKRSLRERTKPVNYKLPPPLTEANAEDYLMREAKPSFVNPSPRRGRSGWNASQNSGPVRRLFPTGGPFGGNDVITVFGKNTNFHEQGGTAAGNNNRLIMDSDSSEDEILPLGAEPKHKKPKLKKKKPEIADLDPLGVDMNVNFSEIGGLDNYIDQLKEMVALPLLYPELYQNFGITPPRGVLFHGPPGTGKTLMARALAASCSSEGQNITFFMRKGADVLSKWVGEAERQLRLLFEEAKKHQPSIIFFDEIDGLAPVRSSKQEQIHASIVSTLLALMDGMDNRGQVIVIGATNRPDAVDPALRRPGRFDREFYFPLPDTKARVQIIKIHTKKWNPPLADDFINSLASLTKGYGGADLRALCTEAALISIQRKYPQIYRSNDKLLVDASKVKVNSGDFMIALKRIVPSSARSVGNPAKPLPESVKPLLEKQFNEIKKQLQLLIPEDDDIFKKDTSLIQHFIDYETFDDDSFNGNISGFTKHDLINRVSDARICQPRLVVTGTKGNGQQYLGAAILNYFERYNVQKLDLASLVSDSTRTVESAVVQGFIEARKRQPSVIYIPNIEMWLRVIPESVIFTLSSLLGSLQSSDKVFLLAIAESEWDLELQTGPLLNLFSTRNNLRIEMPSLNQRKEYFSSLTELLRMKPIIFQTNQKRKVPLEALPLAKNTGGQDEYDENGNILSPTEVMRKNLRSFQHQDMKLKNVLKIKLSGLMDLFKNRYKRFRKPPIDDSFLIHLFEPSTDPNWQPAYVKDKDMILEVATGRRYFNMDLDLIEERLWNGFYSEPKQYLKDIELIYRDANTTGDREKIIKASEMYANAQMGIEEISTPEFLQECKATRKRDLERQELYLLDEQSRIDEEQKQLDTTVLGGEIQVASGNQIQAQIIQPNQDDINPEKQSDDVRHAGTPADNDLGSIGPFSAQGDNNNTDVLDASMINGAQLLDHVENKNIEDKQKGSIINDNESSAVKYSSSQAININHIISENTEYNVNSSEGEQKINVNDKASSNNNSNGKCNLKELMNPENNNASTEGDVHHSFPESDRLVELDEEALALIVETISNKTSNYTVSALQQVYSELVETIWDDRLLWNKLDTIAKILKKIKEL